MPSDLSHIRNIGIIAHIDAGKTTLSERVLFYTRKIHRMGEVHEGAATMDFMPEEQERGITIASACTTCLWGDYSINMIDTPGHVDFTIEVERSLRVLDGAVGVFCAVGGVEPQSETVWRQAEKFHIPRLAFINKLDRPGASFEMVLQAMRERLNANPALLILPVGQGDELDGLIDLVRLEKLHFDEQSQGREVSRRPLDGAEAALAAPWRDKLLEQAADEDDALMELYLAGAEPSVELLESALRKGALANHLVPVFAGAALRNLGVQPLLDGICAFLPGPAETLPALGRLADSEEEIRVAADSDAPFCALAFKVIMEGGRRLALLRIYAGTLKEGQACRNVARERNERIMRIYRLHADRREQLPQAGPGEIVAVQGLRFVSTGDSLCAPEKAVLLEDIASYRPVISLALEPKNKEEGEKLDEALERFCLEDPTLRVETDENTGQRILSGMGELHLEVVRDRLKREYNLAPRYGQPQVLCRESVGRAADAQGEFDRELGEVRHHGWVALRLEPRARGAGNSIVFALPGQDNPKTALPKVWLESVRQGVEDSLQSGVFKGYPVQDVAVTVTELRRKESVSTPAGFHMAAVAAMKEALPKAAPMLLEPIMRLDINVPEAHLGPVLAILSMRGGKIEDMGERGGQKTVSAMAPMRELFGFSTALRSATQGRAGFNMSFDRFDSV